MGKITIKHYLNTKLKGDENNDQLHYPVYVLITFNRKSTNFASEYNSKLSPHTDLNTIKKNSDILKEEERVISDIIVYESAIRGDKFDLKELKNKYEDYKRPIHSILDNYLLNKISKYMNIWEAFYPYNSIYNYYPIQSSFLSLRPHFKDYLYSFERTFPLFKDIIKSEEVHNPELLLYPGKPRLYQEILAYEAYCEFDNPSTTNTTHLVPRLIDWENNKHKNEFISFLNEHKNFRNFDVNIIEIIERILYNFNRILY